MVEKRKEQKVVNISYMQYDKLMQLLVSRVNTKLSNKCKVPGFYGLKRGGYPIAVHLSNHCGLPVLDKPTKGCIICDDISDSGKALSKYKEQKFFIVTLFCKDKSVVKPDIYVKIIPEMTWVVFPWEMRE
jgi:hypoxanthine phosphoribosyltransferase